MQYDIYTKNRLAELALEIRELKQGVRDDAKNKRLRDKKAAQKTKMEMKAGALAAKKSAREFEKLQKGLWDKANKFKAPPKETPSLSESFKQPPIDENVKLPAAVTQQIEIVNSFYEKGKFYPLIRKFQELSEQLNVQGPSFILATPGERSSLLAAYAEITVEVSKITQRME